ncbi:MAG: hypothetical protein HYW47_04825 [Deltaproteobacteria bacterium]|nr:hypothetical protein [Deltaproteobacteria bacterium]
MYFLASLYLEFKYFFSDFLNLHSDTIHVYLGCAVLFLCYFLFKIKLSSFKILIPVFVLAVGMEVVDIYEHCVSYGFVKWYESFKDIINTSLLPTLLVFFFKQQSSQP